LLPPRRADVAVGGAAERVGRVANEIDRRLQRVLVRVADQHAADPVARAVGLGVLACRRIGRVEARARGRNGQRERRADQRRDEESQRAPAHPLPPPHSGLKAALGDGVL
jgi:hypothetical protein